MVVCTFFQQGRCTKGDSCRFEHPAQSSPAAAAKNLWTARAAVDAPSFTPRTGTTPSPCVFFLRGTCAYGTACKNVHDTSAIAAPPPVATVDRRSLQICTFFLRNACTKGAACPFSHGHGQDSPTNTVQLHNTANGASSQPHQGTSTTHANDQSSEQNSSRVIAGATVTFADGAAISKITLPGDFSTLSLTNIPAGSTSLTIVTLLKRWANLDVVELISLKSIPKGTTQAAEVRVMDGGTLNRTLLSRTSELKLDETEICISPVQLGSSESGTNRLQLSGVNCTWYNPSRSATLWYGPFHDVSATIATLRSQSRDLHGRRPTFDQVYGAYAIRVGNLDCQTNDRELKLYCNQHPPMRVEVGQNSHDVTDEDVQAQVKALLESCGRVTEWIVSPQLGTAKVKAYVRFSNPAAAAQAVKALDGSQIDPQYNDKLRVQKVVTVKLPISQRVLKMIRPQLHAISKTLQSADHVSVKAYDNPTKQYTQIRVSGPNKASVARAKLQVEGLLAGTIAHDGLQPLTHPCFFQAGYITFLDEIMAVHGVVILPDRRQSGLRIYGEEKGIIAAQEALKAKVAHIKSQAREIVLDLATLNLAMRGGLQRMITVLGKDKVKLDITSNPKRILITGSDDDVVRAKVVLESQTSGMSEAIAGLRFEDDEASCCAVCWTPAEDPIQTSCGHTYCTTCFESQVMSASDYPVTCLGASGVCNTPLTLQDLQRILANSTYGTLLDSALAKYVRTHPEDFQYCSTPDCDRFYRTSADDAAIVFECDHCLASICTACHGAAHPGETCKEAAAGRDGTDEFSEWKKNNDVRDCPTCSTPIEKIDGCNHMTCRSCEAHICWHCMKVFKTGPEVYGHMTKFHDQDWGLGWTPRDFE